jgi:hypothetical protein
MEQHCVILAMKRQNNLITSQRKWAFSNTFTENTIALAAMITWSPPIPPPQPIEKSITFPGLLAQVATHKYCDALPLYCQTQIFKRFGVKLDRKSLANWMIKCGVLIQPLINLMY